MEDITLESTSYIDSLVEQIKSLDTKGLTNNVNTDAKIDITEPKVYFWTRIFIKEEEPTQKKFHEKAVIYLYCSHFHFYYLQSVFCSRRRKNQYIN